MSVERITYLDSSAIVKLVVEEPESAGLRRFLRRRHRLVSSALAQTEVLRALTDEGEQARRRAREVLRTINLVRLSDAVLELAGELPPPHLRSLDALHLATAQLLGADLGQILTYDQRMADGARALRLRATAPGP